MTPEEERAERAAIYCVAEIERAGAVSYVVIAPDEWSAMVVDPGAHQGKIHVLMPDTAKRLGARILASGLTALRARGEIRDLRLARAATASDVARGVT